ncbi:hypothetical protein CN153_21655 [Sinorhizobium meliloti]|nr:hypothetical protein HB773_17795 [Sinorhizobium meliloti]RMI18574.1 hypothetical protein DA102_023825 [Sinorhizobium meliloti]RVH91352.1 hypothetical protein CN199_23700 [Sinorhizobium meliloti]RVK31909.1 hypothetical protein CN161_20615 [Sinorhizobium meliloti]RVK83615.1 hypothetical protein CN153_21655 [Sinorhizobium meliloti]
MLTLVAMRGRDFALAMRASRLRCPRCGSRRVAVVFMPPLEGDKRRGAAKVPSKCKFGSPSPEIIPELNF